MQSFLTKVAIFAKNKVENQHKKLVFASMKRFNITISSNFEELWRYNIIAVCELCSADGKRIEYKSQESTIAAVGSNLSSPPADYNVERTIVMESAEGEYINLLVYIVPHTLPSTDDIYQTKPFSMNIKVKTKEGVVLNQMFKINQWSGDNIALSKVGITE